MKADLISVNRETIPCPILSTGVGYFKQLIVFNQPSQKFESKHTLLSVFKKYLTLEECKVHTVSGYVNFQVVRRVLNHSARLFFGIL